MMCSHLHPRRCAEFKFSANEKPLRMVSTGASKFRVLTKQKPKPVTCPRGNPLDYQCSYEECKRCKNYICDTVWGPQNVWDYGTPCYRYFVCVPCIDKAKKAAEQAALDPSNKPTFMHCEAGCSLLLQLPRELLGDDLPDAVDDDARSLAVQLQVAYRLGGASPVRLGVLCGFGWGLSC